MVVAWRHIGTSRCIQQGKERGPTPASYHGVHLVWGRRTVKVVDTRRQMADTRIAYAWHDFPHAHAQVCSGRTTRKSQALFHTLHFPSCLVRLDWYQLARRSFRRPGMTSDVLDPQCSVARILLNRHSFTARNTRRRCRQFLQGPSPLRETHIQRNDLADLLGVLVW